MSVVTGSSLYTSTYFVVSAADKPLGAMPPQLSFSDITLLQSREMGTTEEAKQIKFKSRKEKKTGELSRAERGEVSIINTDIGGFFNLQKSQVHLSGVAFI